ncbi:MAG TPA: GtrA family protein [Motiliproteus sp.]
MDIEQLSSPRRQTLTQFWRYFWVGGLAFIGDLATIAALTELLGWHYLISTVGGFLVGISINYYLCVRWVFSVRKYSNLAVERTLFLITGVAGLLLTELCMWLLTEHLALYYLMSKVVTAGAIFVFNFFARKVLLFS